MTEPLLHLLKDTYVRTDVVYRLSLVEEFLDFAFFTDGATSISRETITHFSTQRSNPPEDIVFLTSLPTIFWDAFTQDTFHSIFADMTKKLETLPMLPIVIPIALPAKNMKTIGQWARTVVGEYALLDVSIDPALATGCQFVWKDRLYDFSFEYYLAQHREEINTRLGASFSNTALVKIPDTALVKTH